VAVLLLVAHGAVRAAVVKDQTFDLTRLDVESSESEQHASPSGESHKNVQFTAPMSAGGIEKIFYQGSKQEEVQAELGELLKSRHSSMDAEQEALQIIKKIKKDDTNAALFDLVPLFKGIVADPVRSRAIVKNCINGVKMWVTSDVCKDWGPKKIIEKKSNLTANVFSNATTSNTTKATTKRKTKKASELGEVGEDEHGAGDTKDQGSEDTKKEDKKAVKKEDNQAAKNEVTPSTTKEKSCIEWGLKPMSDAMNSLWVNAQRAFCKKNAKCDATLCYHYPGPMDTDGLPTAKFHTFKQLPLSVFHNHTQSGETVVQQMVDLDIKLEKISLCEKVRPELQVEGLPGMSQPGMCTTSRRCQLVKVAYGSCFDGAFEATKREMNCPDDDFFRAKILSTQMDTVMMLCNKS